METIKFRGKLFDPETNTLGDWVYGSVVHIPDDKEADQFQDEVATWYITSDGVTFNRVNRLTIGQCTCVEDKFGNPIYVGDIIEYPDDDDDDNQYVIGFESGQFVASEIDTGRYWGAGVWVGEFGNYPQVIDNIFDTNIEIKSGSPYDFSGNK
jgi:hypothetical protein